MNGNLEDLIILDGVISVEQIIRFVLIMIVLTIFRFILLKVVFKFTKDPKGRYMWRKFSAYTLTIVIFFTLIQMWLREDVETLGTFLGLALAGLAIALKDLVSNFAGWLFIIWRRPLEVGDRIQIGSHAGDVIDIRVFQFTLMEIGNWIDAEQSTGRIIQVPNGKILTDVLANYSKRFEYIWNEVPVLITFESDWKLAKKILFTIGNKHAEYLTREAEERVRKASQKYMIFYNNLAPTVYTSVKESGVMLTVRYLCQPRKRRSTEQSIWEGILDAFASEESIELAYPTRRFLKD